MKGLVCQSFSLGLFVAEDVVVDVGHEVSSRWVGHDEADVVGRLEAAVHVDQERVSRGIDHLEDPLLTHQAATQTHTTTASQSILPHKASSEKERPRRNQQNLVAQNSLATSNIISLKRTWRIVSLSLSTSP